MKKIATLVMGMAVVAVVVVLGRPCVARAGSFGSPIIITNVVGGGYTYTNVEASRIGIGYAAIAGALSGESSIRVLNSTAGQPQYLARSTSATQTLNYVDGTVSVGLEPKPTGKLYFAWQPTNTAVTLVILPKAP